MQVIHYRVDVYRQIANFEEEAQLKHGDVVNRPYRSSLVVQTYTPGTAVTIQDITDTNEQLTVATAKIIPFYVDDLDALQSNYKTANEYADDAAVKLSNIIDGDVLAEAANATSVVDNADFSGTSGDGITISTSNIQKIFSLAKRRLRKQNIKFTGNGDLFAVISPEMEDTLLQYLAGKESTLGDGTGVAGHIGKYYGFDIYVSNSVYHTARLEMGSAMTAADTITINGVVLTAAATPTAAGDVDVETTAAVQIDTLVASINAPGTSVSGDFVALSAANQALLSGITATDGTTYMTIASKGWGNVVVSEVLTATADVWTSGLQIQHNLFGKKGAIDVVIQAKPKLVTKEVPDKLGQNFLPYTFYGKKTFAEGAKMLVDVKVNSSSF